MLFSVDDASGRYSTGWFWGNHYWTGSRNLCENIGSPLSYDNDTIDVSILKSENIKKFSQRSMFNRI